MGADKELHFKNMTFPAPTGRAEGQNNFRFYPRPSAKSAVESLFFFAVVYYPPWPAFAASNVFMPEPAQEAGLYRRY